MSSKYLGMIGRLSTPLTDHMSEAVGTCFGIPNNVSDDVIFLTNAHVVESGAAHSVEMPWAPGKSIPVRVVSIVYDRDIALVAVRREVWEHVARKYLDGDELLEILKVPTLNLGTDDLFNIHDTNLYCCGYPLGLPTQQVCTGITRGIIDMGVVQRTLISCAINHGNSGGPVMLRRDEKAWVVGISTMKLSGVDVEAEGGMINVGSINAVLPRMMQELIPRQNIINLDDVSPELIAAIQKAFGSSAAGEIVLDTLSQDQCQWLCSNWDTHLVDWETHACGGRVRSTPRPFVSWFNRHIVDADGVLFNGAKLLNLVTTACMSGQYQSLASLSLSGWKNIRISLEDHVHKFQLAGEHFKQFKEIAVSLHTPVLDDLGWLQPTHMIDYKEYYKCENNERGAIINTVWPHSLYGKNGGKDGDLIYAFHLSHYEDGVKTGEDAIKMLDHNGSFLKSGMLSDRTSLATGIQNIVWHDGSPNYTEITLHVRRRDIGKILITFKHEEPDVTALPCTRLIRPFNDESQEATANICGYNLVQLHVNHIEKLKLVEYAGVEHQNDFRLICEGFPQNSVKISPGATLLSMNGVNCTEWKSWDDFKKHCDTFEKEVGTKKKAGVPVQFDAVFGRSGGFKVKVIRTL